MQLIEPDWPAPPGVVSLSTTRSGGCSRGVFSALNLGDHVGDEPERVARNRGLLRALLPPGTDIQWLRQVHGIEVVQAGVVGEYPEADAGWTASPDQACAVLTADCLPVLFCDRAGSVVAAAHAGWRGLLAGVLEATIAALGVAPGELLAWLGPAIGAAAFEVGPEVRSQFLATAPSPTALERCFKPHPVAGGKYLADLNELARQRLRAAGLAHIYGGEHCTFSDAARFYSYRRDGQTGRMATLIYRKPFNNLT